MDAAVDTASDDNDDDDDDDGARAGAKQLQSRQNTGSATKMAATSSIVALLWKWSTYWVYYI